MSTVKWHRAVRPDGNFPWSAEVRGHRAYLTICATWKNQYYCRLALGAEHATVFDTRVYDDVEDAKAAGEKLWGPFAKAFAEARSLDVF